MQDPTFLKVYYEDVSRSLISAITYLFGAGVPGDLAEFGTMNGRTASLLAHFLAQLEKHWGSNDTRHGIDRRSLHLFDSFKGLPAPEHEIDANSPHVRAQIWGKGKLRGVSPGRLAEMVQLHLPPEQMRIYEGFFADTLAQIPDTTRFGLVHIDCDFYESAFQVLDALCGRQLLVPGAILLFDDWNCNRGDPAMGERRAWQDILDRYRVSYSDEGSYAGFGHKFIIHGVEAR